MTHASGAFSASATQALYPTFGNHRIDQLQHAETESGPNVVRLLSAETECPPKVPICPHSAPKPKPKFGRPLAVVLEYSNIRISKFPLIQNTHFVQ